MYIVSVAVFRMAMRPFAATRISLAARVPILMAWPRLACRCPPGFTITTEMCSAYYANGQTFPDSVRAEVANGIAHIEQVTGKAFGDPANPLLVSVRSGARVSMPGMMDTVLESGA